MESFATISGSTTGKARLRGFKPCGFAGDSPKGVYYHLLGVEAAETHALTFSTFCFFHL
jgi:hypothetical protein